MEIGNAVLWFVSVLIVMGTLIHIFVPDPTRRKDALKWLLKIFKLTCALFIAVSLIGIIMLALVGLMFGG